MTMRIRGPNVTVAAVIERGNDMMLVEEIIDGRRVLNQPAGHLEPGESLLDAVRRETLEETAWTFEPEAIVGIYQWVSPDRIAFVRVAFSGALIAHDPHRALDPDIEAVRWLPFQALQSDPDRLRSPLVERCASDFRADRRFPLDLLRD